MQSSRTQALFRYLPGSVFMHEDGFVAKTYRVDGRPIQFSVNRAVFLDELKRELERWQPDQISGIPRPGTVPESEFIFLEPEIVEWDVWPLVFACTNPPCRRIARFFKTKQALDAAHPDRGLVCKACRGRLAQVRYYSAHACGRIKEMFVPKCRSCDSYDNVYLEDTGSFKTASWRCRGCGDAYIQGTRFEPCDCGQYPGSSGRSFMRAFPVRDQRTFHPQMLTLINLDSRTYEELQRHPAKGAIAVASYIGDESNIRYAFQALDQHGTSNDRYTPARWEEREPQLRALVNAGAMSEEEFETIRRNQAPQVSGPASLEDLPADIAQLAEGRRMLERAILFDRAVVTDRRNLDDARREETALGHTLTAEAFASAETLSHEMGIAEVAVTLEFPVLLAAYGYTRTRREPGKSHLKGFARQNLYDGKTPIFASVTKTEAILVTLSAQQVLAWLKAYDLARVAPNSERDARMELLAIFAAGGEAAARTQTLVHSFAHAMLRALDDGQTGFGESSLAEWIVPEALTFGLYVSSFQAYTLGALWTLLHTRTQAWLERTNASVWTCQNDPLCHQRLPRACERCMYLTFGCREFNNNLSRADLMSFWRHTRPPRRVAIA